MHAAGRDVDRSRIEEEPGNGAAIDMHLLELLAVDLDCDAHQLEGGGDRCRGQIGSPRMTKAYSADVDIGQGQEAPPTMRI